MIRAMKMSLAGVGTDEVSLSTVDTGCIPLLGKASVETHPSGCVGEFDIREGGQENDGLVVLTGALIYQGPDEYGSNEVVINQSSPTNAKLSGATYLGSGAFSNVVKLGEDEFMKMPISAALEPSLLAESKILRALQGITNVPQLVLKDTDARDGISIIEAFIRGEESCTRGLRLKGIVGKPLHQLGRKNWSKHKVAIITVVYEALKSAHEKEIYHLDVRPGNVIVKISDEGCCEVLLSDWGCAVQAAQGQKRLKKFRGCPPYAHDFLLGGEVSTELHERLDFASLAYTIDHVEFGQLRWVFDFGCPTAVGVDEIASRRKKVLAWLQKKEENEDFRKLFMMHVGMHVHLLVDQRGEEQASPKKETKKLKK